MVTQRRVLTTEPDLGEPYEVSDDAVRRGRRCGDQAREAHRRRGGEGGIYRRPTRRRHRLGAAVAELVVTQAVDHQQHIALRLRYFSGQPGLETGRRGPTRQPQLELGRQVEQTAPVV